VFIELVNLTEKIGGDLEIHAERMPKRAEAEVDAE
jgi:hypothetical protein